MANVNSLSSNSYSSSSSIYGNRNVLTGLASGMDTETMIENSVSGYQTKITELQQKQTKLEWKQDAYRELIDQMYNITNKYTSYTSSTNLSSNSFFLNNVTTSVSGSNASAATATGKATSDIRINAVTQLATSARYTVDAAALDIKVSKEAVGGAVNWGSELTKGTLSGTMTLKLGSSTFEVKFTDEDKYDTLDALVEGINKKLEEQGADVQASLSNAGDDGSTITFESTGSAKTRGDSVYISGASGNLKSMLDVTTASSSADENRFSYKSFSVKGDASGLTEKMSMAEYLSGKSVTLTLDGVEKSVKIGDLSKVTAPDLSEYDNRIAEINDQINQLKLNETLDSDERKAQRAELYNQLDTANRERSRALNAGMIPALKDDLQAAINKQFGANKVKVSVTDDGGIRFDVAEGSGSTLKVTSEVGKELGIGEAGVSNYFNTSQKLSSLLTNSWLDANARIEGTLDSAAEARYFDKDGNELKLSDGAYYRTTANGGILYKNGEKVKGTLASTLYSDTEGNLLKKYANEDTYYRVNNKGEWLYNLKIGGATIDGITANTTLESVLSKINSSNDAGVRVNYSNLTGQFVFTSQQTGEGSDITFEGALAQKLFGVKDVPANKSLESIFGDTIAWDDDGNAKILVKSPNAYDKVVGTFNKNDSMEKFMQSLNGVKGGALKDWLSYDAATGEYTLGNGYENGFQGRVTFLAYGQTQEISIESLAERANSAEATIGAEHTKGKDAVILATVNGKDLELRRASNVVNMDGLNVTFKEEFSAYDENGEVKSADALTFTTKSDSDTIVAAVKSFVEDINKLMSDVHEAYTTQPIAKTSGSSKKGITYYEPLTEEDRRDMSESAVEKYEEKAKTGLLFGDSDLRSLYDKMLTTLQSFGTDRMDMEAIGITTTYGSGVTTVKLNEAKLREALDSDPDKVRNVFTKTKESGAAADGLMTAIKRTLSDYGSTSLASPGILVSKAGTKLSAVSLLTNNLYKQISNLDSQIESWQTKLSNRIDYYTKQFTALEKMMGTMNNQSSMLSDLMGY